MTSIRRGTVLDACLDPTLGSETGKTRPCIVVTNDVYNRRVPVIQVVPLTEWSEKKGRIVTNVEVAPTTSNGLDKRSVADCLQTRPIDHRLRVARVRGTMDSATMAAIDAALRIVFSLEEDWSVEQPH